MQGITSVIACVVLLITSLEANSVFAVTAEPNTKICGSYTYIPPNGYRTTKNVYEYDPDRVFINDPETYFTVDIEIPSIHCILEKNNGDSSLRLYTKNELLYNIGEDKERNISISDGKCVSQPHHEVYFFSFSTDENAMLYSIAVEMNDEDNKYSSVFVINTVNFGYEAGDFQMADEEAQEQLCTLAKQFIHTIKRH